MRAEGVPPEAWRKGTQWCALTREHAGLFVADQWVFDVFDRCVRATAECSKVEQAAAAEAQRCALMGFDADGCSALFAHLCRSHCVTDYNEGGGFSRFCAGDEHYKQTLIVLHGREAEVERRQARSICRLPTSQRGSTRMPRATDHNPQRHDYLSHRFPHPRAGDVGELEASGPGPPEAVRGPGGGRGAREGAAGDAGGAAPGGGGGLRGVGGPGQARAHGMPCTRNLSSSSWLSALVFPLRCGLRSLLRCERECAELHLSAAALLSGVVGPRPCWLFARKFTPRGAERILTFSREVIGF